MSAGGFWRLLKRRLSAFSKLVLVSIRSKTSPAAMRKPPVYTVAPLVRSMTTTSNLSDVRANGMSMRMAFASKRENALTWILSI